MERPVKVLHLIDGLGGGGSERLLYDIVRLSDPVVAEHRIVTIHPDRGKYVYAEPLRKLGVYSRKGPELEKAERPTLPEAQGVKLAYKCLYQWWAIRKIYHWGIFFVTACLTFVEYIRFRPDIIHAHTFYGLMAGLIARMLTKKPLFVTVPAMFQQMEAGEYYWAPARYIKHHDMVVKYFTAYPKELSRAGVPDQKILPLGHAVNLEAAKEALYNLSEHRANVRKALGLEADSIIALSVGRLSSEKGHNYVIEALPEITKNISKLYWILLGSGTEEKVLKRQAENLGVADRAHFLGFIENPFPYYAAADIYLRTTVMESDNISSVSAMAVGLPVVGFDTGSETEQLGIVGHGMLVPNKDSAALGQAVVKILETPDKGKKLGERGRIYCHQRYDIRRVVNEQYLGAYIASVNAKR